MRPASGSGETKVKWREYLTANMNAGLTRISLNEVN
jgi:hypothetical protein